MKKLTLVFCMFLLVCGGLFAQNVSLDQAVQTSAKTIESRLAQGSKVAVLVFTSSAQAFSDYILDEIATAVSASNKIQVIDRQHTDAIRKEFNIQFSGDVSDSEVKRVGQQLGAQYVVTGSLVDIGNAYRFRIAAINIESAVREGSSSLNININDPQVVFLLTGQREGQAGSTGTAAVNPNAAPRVSLGMPEIFSLDPNKPNEPQLAATITVNHPAPIKNWHIQIQLARQAPAAQLRQRKPFFEQTGTGTPPRSWQWNGRGTSGNMAQSVMDYQFVLTVTDIFDNTATAEGILSTDILVWREGNHYRIIVPLSSIVFPGGSADLSRVSEQDQRSNNRILRLIARALNRFEGYKVIIEGHSNPEYAPGTPTREREETTELIPLSKSRADAVLNWLVNNGGVARGRLSAVGIGGRRPIVAFHEDPEEKANNRRIEFILER